MTALTCTASTHTCTVRGERRTEHPHICSVLARTISAAARAILGTGHGGQLALHRGRAGDSITIATDHTI
jgi:hypothetical protein